jgi:hypothetical protein
MVAITIIATLIKNLNVSGLMTVHPLLDRIQDYKIKAENSRNPVIVKSCLRICSFDGISGFDPGTGSAGNVQKILEAVSLQETRGSA